MRRRILAAAVICLVLSLLAGAGLWLQSGAGWGIDYSGRASRESFVTKDKENENAVAVPDGPAAKTKGGTASGEKTGEAEKARSGERKSEAKNTSNKSKDPLAPVLRATRHSKPLIGAPTPGDRGPVKLRSGGLDRQMTLRVPVGALPRQSQATGPRPLIIAFHGYGQSGESMARFSDLDTHGAIVAFPDGVGQAWSGAPYSKSTGAQDVALIKDIINRTAATYQVDDRRIYAVGMSNGGGFTAKLACDLPHEFAAFASVAGAYYPGTWQGCVKKQHPGQEKPRFDRGASASFLEIHGQADKRINYDGGERMGQHYLGALAFSNAYARRAGCSGAPAIRSVSPLVRRFQWHDCAAGRDVMHIAVSGMGHTWPGESAEARPGESGAAAHQGTRIPQSGPSRALNASAEILSFFERHTK